MDRCSPIAVVDERQFAQGLGLTLRELRRCVRAGWFPPFAQLRGKPLWLGALAQDALFVEEDACP